jgi:pimeloyl-ACP methyl ester carboxylesterase
LLLNDRWRQEKQIPGSTIHPQTREWAEASQAVFVPGLANGIANVPFFSTYFGANIKTLKNEFKMDVSYFGPKSSLPMEKNSAHLAQYLQGLYKKTSHKPVILIGHSKGGAECLLSVLKNPWLFDRIVSHVVLIQAAIGGSEFVHEGDISYVYRLLSLYYKHGVDSLKQGKAHQVFQKAFAKLDQYLFETYGHLGVEHVLRKRKELSRKVFYVRSVTGPNEKLSIGLKILLSLGGYGLTATPGNDGLLSAPDQIPELGVDNQIPFGIDLGVLHGDHIELTVSGPVSRGRRSDQAAFTRALMEQIHQSSFTL